MKNLLMVVLTGILLFAAAAQLSADALFSSERVAGNGLITSQDQDHEKLRDATALYGEARAYAREQDFAKAEESALAALASLDASAGDTPFGLTLRAHIYLELIYDGATWGRYNPGLEQTVARLEELGIAQTDLDYIEAKRLLLFPPEAGGNLASSIALFEGLPDDEPLYEQIVFHARALQLTGESEQAAALLRAALIENPQDDSVRAAQAKLQVELAAPRISRIDLPVNVRTRKNLLSDAILLTVGSTLSMEEAEESIARLTAIPSVVAAGFRYDYDVGRNEVLVDVAIREAADRTLTVALSTTVQTGAQADSWVYTDELSPPLPVIIYNDVNLFGAGHELQIITAGVYNYVSLALAPPRTPALRYMTSVEGLLIPEERLRFFADDRSEVEEEEIRSSWGAASLGIGYSPSPLLASKLTYTLRKDWFRDAEYTNPALVLPDDLQHTIRADATVGMISRQGPGGVVPVGFSLSAGASFDHLQGFTPWGPPGALYTEPDNGLGTVKYNFGLFYGTRSASRFDASVAANFADGHGYYTRTLYRVGAGGALGAPPLQLRGYRPGEFLVERGWAAHLSTGYEIVPGRLHMALFADGAIVDAEGWNPLASTGTTLSALLPWEISGQLEIAHSFLDLDGSTENYHTTFELRLMRSFTF